MYKVLMFGTEKSSNIVASMLKDDVEILAYIDNDKNKWGSRKNDKIILGPHEIGCFEYDYIVIGDHFNTDICEQLLNIGIDKNEIFQYYLFLDNNLNYYKWKISDFVLKYRAKAEVLNTGMFYSWVGFKADACIKKAFNFAFSSQDLFYDYLTVKYLLKNWPEKTDEVRYVFIGLSYYSFQYDMSLSSMRHNVVLYYDILKEAHHFDNIEGVYEDYAINKEIADKLLRNRDNRMYGFKWNMTNLDEYEDKWSVGKKQAEIDCNKDYPETVAENIEIFQKYLELLKDYSIKPIVVVYPASKYYYKNFSEKIEQEFHGIINEMRERYNFQYLDYFRKELFNDEDFGGVSYLNYYGAIKFTKLLNEQMDWS
ncbi:chemotaxis protein [Clostridium oryzae]|uniref:chemotaxis protein n=1 Tax=Clostridium oryzae TaxID=1450648 RepID=UPI0009A53875|nr:chemotaxis protein [Clostridium oryzae]